MYVHTGDGTRGKQPNGTADSSRFYWNSGNYVWNNDKDTATLRSGSGRAYDPCQWTKPGKGSTLLLTLLGLVGTPVSQGAARR